MYIIKYLRTRIIRSAAARDEFSGAGITIIPEEHENQI
jgi:hypothetical protein